jgi:DNA-binding transcriptional LysR family regulator
VGINGTYGVAMDWDSRLIKQIKLRDLQILKAAVDAGSMMKAANVLAITQPAVSHAVAEMEHVLGVSLLDRTSIGVSPTIYGQALLTRAAVAFNELRQGISDIESLADPTVGELRMGTTPPMSAVASAVYNRLVPQYPRMRFELSVASTDKLLRQLRQRDIEFVISRLTDWMEVDDLSVKTLFYDELAVLCSKHNKWARRRNVSLADLINEPWVLPAANGSIIRIIKKAFEERGLDVPRPTVETPHTYALSLLVSNGPFLTMHPKIMLATPSHQHRLAAVDVRLPVTRGPIALIMLKGRSLSPAANLFVQFAAAVAKEMAPSARPSATGVKKKPKRAAGV